MNPRDYQRLAEQLIAGTAPRAAECRAAISRAYYAAFNVAGELLRGMNISVGRGGGAHGEIRLCLGNSGDQEVIDAALKLADLHSARIRADYHLDRTDIEDLVTSRAMVMRAADVIQVLDATFSGTKRPQLEVAIRTWRRANGYA